jgi:hypothetical protein
MSKSIFFSSKIHFPYSDWLRGQFLPYHSSSTKLKQSTFPNEMGESMVLASLQLRA